MSNAEIDRQWTTRLRRRVEGKLPPEKVLPDTQPSYVASWIYVFGVATLASLGVVIFTGCVLALRGPQWWHGSQYGHFVNSLHLWSVEIFFFTMVIHLWGKFAMAAWRGGRTLTWMTGVVTFLASIATAFTGYASQSNFDSQWITTQAKDGINATRRRRLLQRLEPRTDADVAHRPVTDRGGGADCTTRDSRAHQGRGASL